MHRGVSLYLDVVRFGAAFVVFLGHIASRGVSGGIGWQLAGYGSAAVMTFFVLSGFVIAHVLNDHESNARAYTVARLSRLYSVVLPALILTAVCQYLVRTGNPAFLHAMPWNDAGGDTLAHFIATFSFTNQFWVWPNPPMEPLLDSPFWSLSNEAAYYVAAGLMFFSRGALRIAALTILGILAGPEIIALAPIWFAGMGLYYLKDKISLAPGAAVAFAAIGLVILLCAPWVSIHDSPEIRLPMLNCINGIGFSIHLFGALYLGRYLERALAWCSRVVRWLGSLTFALYLFHLPLILLVSAYGIGPVDSWEQRALVLTAPLIVVTTVGWWCERQKGTIRRAMNRVAQRWPAAERGR